MRRKWVRPAVGVIAFAIVLALAISSLLQIQAISTEVRQRRGAEKAWLMARIAMHESTGQVEIVPCREGTIDYDGTPWPCELTGSVFVWDCCPAEGGPIPLVVKDATAARYFGRSRDATPEGKRWYLFSAPVRFRLMTEGEVDQETHAPKQPAALLRSGN